jgi:hypothetical protein
MEEGRAVEKSYIKRVLLFSTVAEGFGKENATFFWLN